MTCRELADFIADYLSDALDPVVRREFDHHLTLCANCRRYLASYTTLLELQRQAFADDEAPVPADVPEELVKAILAARAR